MTTVVRVASAIAVTLLLTGCGVSPRSSSSTTSASGPCPHTSLDAAEGMATVRIGFDDGTLAFGDGGELRICPYGFKGLPVVLTLPEGVTASPEEAPALGDGEPVAFRLVASDGASGDITWRVGSKAEGLQATGRGPRVVSGTDGWHLEFRAD